MFESSCLTAQDVNLQRRRFLAHQGKWRPKPLLLLLPLKNEKNFLCSAGIYSLICLWEEGTESLWEGRVGAIQLIPLLHLAWGDTKNGHWSIGLIRNDQIQGLGVFLSHSNQVKTNNRSTYLIDLIFERKRQTSFADVKDLLLVRQIR